MRSRRRRRRMMAIKQTAEEAETGSSVALEGGAF